MGWALRFQMPMAGTVLPPPLEGQDVALTCCSSAMDVAMFVMIMNN